MSNISEELLQMRKRARRRLVGAIALVVFALIVLWTALDGEPPANLAASRPVEIVSSSSNLASAVIAVPLAHAAPSPAPQPAAQESTTASHVAAELNADQPIAQTASAAPEILPGKLVNKQIEQPTPTRKPVAKPTVKPTAKPQVRDPRLILEGRDDGERKPDPKPVTAKFFVQVAAFADAGKAAQVVTKLKQAGLPAYSEKVKTAQGELTRVRIGPAQDRAHAAELLKKAQAVGVNGQVVGK